MYCCRAGVLTIESTNDGPSGVGHWGRPTPTGAEYTWLGPWNNVSERWQIEITMRNGVVLRPTLVAGSQAVEPLGRLPRRTWTQPVCWSMTGVVPGPPQGFLRWPTIDPPGVAA